MEGDGWAVMGGDEMLVGGAPVQGYIVWYLTAWFAWMTVVVNVGNVGKCGLCGWYVLLSTVQNTVVWAQPAFPLFPQTHIPYSTMLVVLPRMYSSMELTLFLNTATAPCTALLACTS